MDCRKLGVAKLVLALSIAALPSFASAEDMMKGMDMGGGAADAGYMKAMQTMQEGMQAAKPTGDADRDFVLMMLPHHQAAVDMAKVELDHGKDRQLRKMARDIVKAQEKEIGEMRAWLAKHPG
ncbi:CopM family metallochaperone [Labrys monachus]|uniref:Uncharacterized protein (DUF305 family) n=1 Tax=Labrys monachus TaxID=217067 RepID=A0ABU0F937_9HYPH|nr:DUF305 domain-containing protein [Labrys monachus]MDQ0390659.1 uncharacterized protein (DUF305 family) [Labrys monachus]